MIKMGQIALKGVNWVHNDTIRSYSLESSQLCTQCIKSGQMVLKGVNWVHNDKIRLNGLERSQLGSQCKIRSYGLERNG